MQYQAGGLRHLKLRLRTLLSERLNYDLRSKDDESHEH
jgi:hypothetical protein